MTTETLSAPETNLSLGDFFFNHAQKYAQNLCQIDADSGQSETYASVCQRSARLATYLQTVPITQKDLIVNCCANSLDNTIPIIAGAFLGVKTANLDVTLSARQIAHLLNITTPKIIFVDENAVTLIEESLDDLPLLKPQIIVLGTSEKHLQFSDLMAPKPEEHLFRPVLVDPSDVAFLLFSSGTTGLSKAISFDASFVQSKMQLAECGDYTSSLQFTSFYWLSAFSIMLLTFMAGGVRIFSKNIDGKFILQTIQKYRVTQIFLTPLYTYNLTSAENPEQYDVSSLKVFLTAGTPISAEQFTKLRHLFKNAAVLVGYGSTEMSGIVTMFHPEKERDLIGTKIGSSGRPLKHVLVRVVNPDTEEILEAFNTGELRVKTSYMMSGYYKMDSSGCFDKDHYFKTGDLGYYDNERCFYIVGRSKEMFKYQSWHIIPSFIEGVIMEHAQVKEAVVVGVSIGPEGDVPAAILVLQPGATVTISEVEDFVAQRVADREKLRGGVKIVEQLPKTPGGKIIRGEAKKLLNF